MNKHKFIYFIGIGGIGMSALARFYKYHKYEVAGYDSTPSELTGELENSGISIHYNDGVENIPEKFRDRETIVVYTPAIPDSSKELNYFRQNGNRLMKRAAMLGHIARDRKVFAVAGTHGKTTTSTMLAYLLTKIANGCTAFLGGISKNYDTNLLLSTNNVMVAEADEYDRSFLQLYPYVAVVTAADADHLDIYGTEHEMKKSFGDFVSQISSDGALVLKKGVDIPLDGTSCKIYSYSLDDSSADFYASDIKNENGFYSFTVHTPFYTVENCKLGTPGKVNVENAVAAVAASCFASVAGKDCIRELLKSFSGVKRRFDIQVNTSEHVYIDDYAHHPEELNAAISSVRQMFPNRKITGVFQPHLFTRTRDFADGFARSLSLLDELILLDIYPARELPIEGVSSQIIFDKVTLANKQMCSKDQLINLLENTAIDVLITMGAGDIDRFVEPVKNLFVGT
ncbi:MAG: UDP-N-acetylmuramate--L-alanine ligase [Prevotellaceae bacterium]|jgi:UDP-N-acetylmuramate--alanine ligase|nr:UDP-N-acetylmuramate--L-alanine ligase [Prevotellaceae bacterium]